MRVKILTLILVLAAAQPSFAISFNALQYARGEAQGYQAALNAVEENTPDWAENYSDKITALDGLLGEIDLLVIESYGETGEALEYSQGYIAGIFNAIDLLNSVGDVVSVAESVPAAPAPASARTTEPSVTLQSPSRANLQ